MFVCLRSILMREYCTGQFSWVCLTVYEVTSGIFDGDNYAQYAHMFVQEIAI